MRFLFRLVAWILLIGLLFRALRSLMSTRRRETMPPPNPARRSARPGHIEDATFTEIPKP